jgi:hypothetical protein
MEAQPRRGMLPRAQQRKRDMSIVEGLYALLGVDTPYTPAGSHAMADVLDVGYSPLERIVHNLRDLGAMTTEVAFAKATPKNPKPGKVATWTLTRPLEEVRPEIERLWQQEDEHHHQGMHAPRPVRGTGIAAVRAADPAELASHAAQRREVAEALAPYFEKKRADRSKARPISTEERSAYQTGPDPEPAQWAPLRSLRKDEPAALVESVRQWRNRGNLLEAKLAELVGAGIAVDPDAFRRSANLGAGDPETLARYRAIVDVLPYIEDLERSVANLQKQIDPYRSKVRELEAKVTELERARALHRATVAATVPPPVLSD